MNIPAPKMRGLQVAAKKQNCYFLKNSSIIYADHISPHKKCTERIFRKITVCAL
jgi:hypothetical protein